MCACVHVTGDRNVSPGQLRPTPSLTPTVTATPKPTTSSTPTPTATTAANKRPTASTGVQPTATTKKSATKDNGNLINDFWMIFLQLLIFRGDCRNKASLTTAASAGSEEDEGR